MFPDDLFSISFTDYLSMFKLTAIDMKENTLEYFSLPSFFNEEMAKRQHNTVSLFDAKYQAYLSNHMTPNPNRYYFVEGALQLCFPTVFDVALSAFHFFSDDLNDVNTIVVSVKEATVMSAELRLFPIMKGASFISNNVPAVILQLQQANYGVEIHSVECPITKQTNAMMRVYAERCDK